jgi:aryl-alcohol dehydrogenase-like predicted oxidoreductase
VHDEGLRLSAHRLGLGTAQFGLGYGITNEAGKVPASEVDRILARARAAGVDLLDTAAGYGDAEAVLGSANAAGRGFRIVTKISGPPSGFAEAARACATRLGTVPDAVLLHDASILAGTEGGAAARALLDLREKGLARAVGLSVYAPAALEAAVGLLSPDIVQLPFNALDRRFERSGWLERLAGMGIEVHARSLFLQGALLAPSTPPRLDFAEPRFDAFRRAAAMASLTALELCLAVGLSARLDRLIIGVTSEAELSAILEATGRAPHAPRGIEDLATDDLRLVDPSRWPR